jgi:hypothetical protein
MDRADWTELDRIAGVMRRAARILEDTAASETLVDPLGGNTTGDEIAADLNRGALWLDQLGT